MKLPGTLRWALLAIVIVLLVAPIALYALNFGSSLSSSHTRWAEMGDFVGGIYAPILALLTLSIIAGQFASQVFFNKHNIDHTFLSNARSDLHFYIDQLDKILTKHEQISNVPLGHALVSMFGSRTHEQLKGAIPIKDVRRIGMTDTRISGMWGAIYTIFAGLKACDETDYALVYSGAKQKCIAVFGYALCDALDNYHFSICQFPENFPYEFHSPPPAEP